MKSTNETYGIRLGRGQTPASVCAAPKSAFTSGQEHLLRLRVQSRFLMIESSIAILHEILENLGYAAFSPEWIRLEHRPTRPAAAELPSHKPIQWTPIILLRQRLY